MEDSTDRSGFASTNFDDQEETSILVATDTEPTEWTDEKHSRFLKSMESTFVNQLYKSIDLFGWQSHKNCPSGSKSPSKHKLTSVRSSSGQFKVLRDGCWSKIDFTRDEHEVDQEGSYKVPLANPWIRHYRNSEIQAIRKFPASCAEDPLENTDSMGSNTEVTDQNFNDEAVEEEESSRIPDMKTIDTSTDIFSCKDQVVPFGNIDVVDKVAEDHVTSGR